MYRVAIIQNESEMQRTGYANVIAKIRTIEYFKNKYSFDLFTVVNISQLFENGSNNILKYDSLIITTNATSDKMVYDKLQNEKLLIASFIELGKGIFIVSQKKLSKGEKGNGGLTKFLPEKYDFYTTPRPEESSSFGTISITEKNINHILLNYPQKIDINSINKKCEDNSFMKHYYRSRIIPIDNIAYTSILQDNGNSYENKIERDLLMINTYPEQNERIILSTIALDWEFHTDLLINIIAFITEGFPQIAFVDKNDNTINYLVESANILKKSYAEYKSLSELNDTNKKFHEIYILSNKYNEKEINEFLATINSYSFIKKRVYQIKEENDILKLNRYTNYSSIDKIIEKTISWLESKHPISGGMWNGSFWTTYEILLLFDKIGIDFNNYINTILKEIREHYNESNSSYDGVVSATCGLVQLLLLLKNKNYSQDTFSDHELKGMIKWITNEKRFNSQSAFDKRNIILIIGKENFNLNEYEVTEENLKNMIKAGLKSDFTELENSVIEKCQIVSVSLLSNDFNSTKIESSVNSIIQEMQNVISLQHGQNIGILSDVLIFFLNNFDTLIKINSLKNRIDDFIYRGILFLRSNYNSKNWGEEDIQASAKAAHAIFLYNEKNHSSLYDYDVLKIIEEENSDISYSALLKDLVDSLRTYKTSFLQLKEISNKSKNKNEELTISKSKLQLELDNTIASSEAEIIKIKKVYTIITYILFFIISVFTTNWLHDKQIIKDSVFESIIAGFITFVMLEVGKFASIYFYTVKSQKSNNHE